jgi:RNA-directed DNA polymerase
MRTTNQASGEKVPNHVGITIIEQMVERGNMLKAYERVKSNKGAPGIDEMTVEELKPYLQKHWAEIKLRLLNGTYKPQAVRQVSIPKPNGGERLLGIPTVLDRLIQQALHQTLNPYFEPTFSENSYGFRAGKSAQQAVEQARKYQTEGKRWVIDMDIAKFFDEVNHDRLIMRIKQRVNDGGLLRLLRKYLKTGIMTDGITTIREKGTPQGSPLSPLLSNIVLDELDKELERRGHSFCRYADDCNIYVNSRKAAERVMQSIASFVEQKLRLRINKDKSAVDRPWKRTFLGYSYTWHKQARIRVPENTVKRFKSKVKRLFRQGRGRNIGRFINEGLNPLIRGWINYFKLTEVKQFAEDLDSWIRHRLRNIIWRQWKKPKTRRKKMIQRGISEERASKSAYNGRGAWWNSGQSHMNECFKKKYFEKIGLLSMLNFVITNRND